MNICIERKYFHLIERTIDSDPNEVLYVAKKSLQLKSDELLKIALKRGELLISRVVASGNHSLLNYVLRLPLDTPLETTAKSISSENLLVILDDWERYEQYFPESTYKKLRSRLQMID